MTLRLETALVNQILSWLNIKAISHVHIRNTGVIYTDRASGRIRMGRSIHTQRGAPDIIALKGGTAYAIECKSPTGRLSPEQMQWLENWGKNGGEVIVARELGHVMNRILPLPTVST